MRVSLLHRNYAIYYNMITLLYIKHAARKSLFLVFVRFSLHAMYGSDLPIFYKNILGDNGSKNIESLARHTRTPRMIDDGCRVIGGGFEYFRRRR